MSEHIQVLADLLHTSGRTEQKVDDLSDRLAAIMENHEQRIGKLEKIGNRVVAVAGIVTVPTTFLYNFITRKHSA